MRELLLFLTCLFLVTGCRQPLEVYIDSVSGDQLASNHVDTPDPRRTCPDIGQMLVVTWNLPRAEHTRDIYLTIRYGDRTESEHHLILNNMRGLKIFELVNESYCQKQGIASFKASLYDNGCHVETVQHMLWCDLITLDQRPEPDRSVSDETIEWL